jgi:hypothetical protein
MTPAYGRECKRDEYTVEALHDDPPVNVPIRPALLLTLPETEKQAQTAHRGLAWEGLAGGLERKYWEVWPGVASGYETREEARE